MTPLDDLRSRLHSLEADHEAITDAVEVSRARAIVLRARVILGTARPDELVAHVARIERTEASLERAGHSLQRTRDMIGG